MLTMLRPEIYENSPSDNVTGRKTFDEGDASMNMSGIHDNMITVEVETNATQSKSVGKKKLHTKNSQSFINSKQSVLKTYVPREESPMKMIGTEESKEKFPDIKVNSYC